MDFGDTGVDAVDGNPSLFEDVDTRRAASGKGCDVRRDCIEVVIIDDVGLISVPDFYACKKRCSRCRDVDLVFTWGDACDASCRIKVNVSCSGIDRSQGISPAANKARFALFVLNPPSPIETEPPERRTIEPGAAVRR